MKLTVMHKEKEVEVDTAKLSYMLLTKDTLQEMIEMLDPEQIGNVIIGLYNTISSESYAEENLTRVEKGLLHRLVSDIANMAAWRKEQTRGLRQYNSKKENATNEPTVEPVKKPIKQYDPDELNEHERMALAIINGETPTAPAECSIPEPPVMAKPSRWSVNSKGVITINSTERMADIPDIFDAVFRNVIPGEYYRNRCAADAGFAARYRDYAIDTVHEHFNSFSRETIAESFSGAKDENDKYLSSLLEG